MGLDGEAKGGTRVPCLDGPTRSLEPALGPEGAKGLAGEGLGEMGHTARAGHPVAFPALPWPCCPGWQALTLRGPGLFRLRQVLAGQSVAQEAGPMGGNRGGLESGRGDCGAAGRTARQQD